MQPTSPSNTSVGSSSSASDEEREAATDNSFQRKRRQMATGHGVQQIPETSTVLISPQQQEQPTLPPVEQRLVAEHQSAATASFVGTELTETDRPNPVAAFAEAPAADEPLAIQEAGPAAEEIPLEGIATNLLPSQQEERQTGTSQTAAVATTATQSLSSASALATISSPYASPTRSVGRSAAQMAPATPDTDLDMAVVMALDAALEVAIDELEHFSVLGSAELYVLEPLRDHMTYSQLWNVITKIDLLSVDLETVLAWQQALENRRRDPLGLGLEE